MECSPQKIFILVIGIAISASLRGQSTFTEQASTWNLDIGGAKDGGHGWSDYDNDGDFDLLVNTNQDASAFRSFLLRNDGGTFTDVTSTLAPYLKTGKRERVACWADFNSDGLPDFFRNSSFAGIEIYLQDPVSGVFGNGSGGTIPQIFDNSNIADGLNSEGAGVLDFDSDGDYDIIFDNHDYGIDILENNGDGIFIHSTAKANSPNPPYNVADPSTWPLGLVQDATDGDYGSVTDVDNDGYVDFVSRKQDQVDFFKNDAGVFVNGQNIGQAHNDNKGAISFQDFDNDGDFDMFWTENGPNEIHINNGGVFTALGSSTGIPTTFSTAIDALACGDVDNDGDIDIFLAGDNRGFLFINQLNSPTGGAGTGPAMSFTLSSQTFHSGRDGEGCTFIDIDQDGDLDLYININGNKNQLYINQLSGVSSNNYVFLDITDTRTEMGLGAGEKMMAIGSTVQVLDCDGNIISGIREINGGSGHGTMDAPRIHFGLPDGPNQQYVFRVAYPHVNGQRRQFHYMQVPSALGAYHYVEAEISALITASPVAMSDSIQVCIGSSVTFDPLLDNGLGADYDPDGTALGVSSVSSPSQGSAVLNADGTVTYTPGPGFSGLDSIPYVINDEPLCLAGGLEDEGMIYVTGDTSPVGGFPVLEVIENQTLSVTGLAEPNFLAYFSDNSVLTSIVSSGSTANGGSYATNADGTYSYTPAAGFSGQDSFPMSVCDACGCISYTIIVNVLADNDNDGVSDKNDLDDDNDGILDLDEASCNPSWVSTVQWHHNTAPVLEAKEVNSQFIQSAQDMAYGSGIGGVINASLVEMSGVDASNLADAQDSNDFLQYSFTTPASINEWPLIALSQTKHPFWVASSENYGYHAAVLISQDGFLSYDILVSDYYCDSNIPTNFQTEWLLIGSNPYLIKSSTNYSLRVYFFGREGTGPLFFDDLILFGEECITSWDYDIDGIYNHHDYDSDNDGIYDAVESGSNESHSSGQLTGAVNVYGIPLSVSSGSSNVNYTYNDADTDGNLSPYDADSDADGCPDVIEAGLPDSNGDGQLGGLFPPAVDSNGSVTSGGL